MKFSIPLPAANVRVALQRAGYAPFRDPKTGQDSFIRRLGTHFYPRFHLYVQERKQVLVLNLHLDQKQPSYGRYTKHSGEYDGSTVETEVERIKTSLI